MQPIVIVVPAWGVHYVNYATAYTVPAAKAALAHAKSARPVKWRIYTDDPAAFGFELAGEDVDWRRPPPGQNGFEGLTVAHRETLDDADDGSIVVLLNSDIVMSIETIAAAEKLFAETPARVVASVGVRSVIGDAPPPIGATAAELNEWIWRNQHPITTDLIYKRGKSSLPTCLFFEDEHGVVMHGFHLCPILLLKDRINVWGGTIDDDLLGAYADDEVFYTSYREFSFAELSPASKVVYSFLPLDDNLMVSFIKSKIFKKAHLRNFRHPLRIIGDGPVDTSAVSRILGKFGL